MKIAIISDIHSNLEALEACFAEIDRERADDIVCLGDMIGYGADPNPCVERIRGRTPHVVAGNHDFAVIGHTPTEYFNLDALTAVIWTRGELSPENRGYLATLPLVLELGGALFVHASPSRPADWNYVRTLREAKHELAAFNQRLCFIGHSHFPEFFIERAGEVVREAPPEMTLRPGERALVNVGSVGQPRDGNPRASFALYDTDAGRVEIRRVAYNVERVRDRILDTDLPASAARRLAWGL